MYQNILIATDGTPPAQKALTHGLALAGSMGASVTIVTVTENEKFWLSMDMTQDSPRDRQMIEELGKTADTSASNVLEGAAEIALATGIPYETRHVRDRHPAEGIVQAADDSRCDLIVMSSHGRRGIDRVLLGSTASEVLAHASVPVLIVR